MAKRYRAKSSRQEAVQKIECGGKVSERARRKNMLIAMHHGKINLMSRHLAEKMRNL